MDDVPRAPSPPTATAALASRRAGPTRGRRRGRRRREPRPRGRRAAAAPGARSATATRACGCWSRRARSATCGRWGRATATPASGSRSGPARALGVAFGVNGSLADAAATRPARRLGRSSSSTSGTGRSSRGSCSAELYPTGSTDPAGGRGRAVERAIGADEFWRRLRRRARAPRSTPWPPRVAAAGRAHGSAVERRGGVGDGDDRRARLERLTGCSSLCADAVRRRALVERAARPARFGGGELALVSARLADAEIAARRGPGRGGRAGRGARRLGGARPRPGARRALRAPRRDRPAAVRPPRARSCGAGAGWLHRVDGRAEAEFALRVPRRRVAVASLARGALP